MNLNTGLEQVPDLIQKMAEVQATADSRYRAGQDVVEDECGNREPRHERSHRIPYDHIDAAAHVHAATLHVHGANGETEEHDTENEPGGASSNCLLGNTPSVKGGGCEVA